MDITGPRAVVGVSDHVAKMRAQLEELEDALVDALTEDIGEFLWYLTDPKNVLRSEYVVRRNETYGLPSREDMRDLNWSVQDLNDSGWWIENDTFPLGGGGLFMPIGWVTDRDAWVTADQAAADERIKSERARVNAELQRAEDELSVRKQQVARLRAVLAELEG